MTDTWQDILEQQATLPIDTTLVATSYFMPLPQYGFLQIEGEDAHNFLQNLLTNDVSNLAVNQGQLTGFCNAKGRLFSLFLLIKYQSHYQIVLPKTMCAALQQRLSMYVLRSKVLITDITDNLACIGLKGPADFLAEYTHQQTDHSLIQYPNTDQQFLYLCPEEQASELCQALQEQQWQLTSEKLWDLLDIEAGLPLILPDSKEKFTPQQVNLDLVSGVSFNKGCYPGQEIVARLHYLGTPSRRMFLATIASNALPNSGDEVTDKSSKVIGHVVRSQINDKNSARLLLSLKLSNITQDAFINGSVEVKNIQSLENS